MLTGFRLVNYLLRRDNWLSQSSLWAILPIITDYWSFEKNESLVFTGVIRFLTLNANCYPFACYVGIWGGTFFLSLLLVITRPRVACLWRFRVLLFLISVPVGCGDWDFKKDDWLFYCINYSSFYNFGV